MKKRAFLYFLVFGLTSGRYLLYNYTENSSAVFAEPATGVFLAGFMFGG